MYVHKYCSACRHAGIHVHLHVYRCKYTYTTCMSTDVYLVYTPKMYACMYAEMHVCMYVCMYVHDAIARRFLPMYVGIELQLKQESGQAVAPHIPRHCF